jgi:Tfp pilus assembly protein PilN
MRAVNLIPAEQRSGGSVSGRSDGAAFVVLGLLGGLVILALLYGIARHQIASRHSQAAALTAQAQQVQARAQQLAPYASFMAMREQRLQAVSQLVGDRFDWAHTLHEMGRVLPYTASLTSIQGTIGTTSTTPGSASALSPAQSASATSTSATTASAASASAASTPAAVASATPAGAVPTLTVSGCATTQSEVAQTLVRLRLIDGVSNVTLQSSTKSDNAGSASGGCPGGDPAFTAQVTFQPLPSPLSLNPGASGSSATPASTAGVQPAGGQASLSSAYSGSAR